MVRGLTGGQPVKAEGELLVGLDDGDDRALIATTDFFTPVVDDPYDWGASPPPTRSPTSTPWVAGRSSR